MGFNEAIGLDEEFAHDGQQGDFARFASLSVPMVETGKGSNPSKGSFSRGRERGTESSYPRPVLLGRRPGARAITFPPLWGGGIPVPNLSPRKEPSPLSQRFYFSTVGKIQERVVPNVPKEGTNSLAAV